MPGLKAERNAAILQMLAQGQHTQTEVGRHFGISKNAVSAVVKRAKDGYADPRWKTATGETFDIPAPIVPRFPSADEIAAFIARNGIKRCPTVALNPTQAELQHNPGIDDRWIGKTGWPASEARNNGARKGGLSMKSLRRGAVL